MSQQEAVEAVVAVGEAQRMQRAGEGLARLASPDEVRRRVSTARRHRSIVVVVLRTAVLAAVLGIWQLLADTGHLDKLFFSSPSAIWEFGWHYVGSGSIWPNLAATVEAILLGFATGSIGGLVVGILVARYEMLDRVTRPYFAGLNSLPRVALAPLFVLWLGLGLVTKVALAVSLVFFVVLIAVESSIKSADPELVRMGSAMGASRRQVFRKVVLPSSVPGIFGGLRLGLVYALLGVVLGEMLASRNGLGEQLNLYAGTYRTDGVFALLVVLGLLGMALNGIAVLIESKLQRWKNG